MMAARSLISRIGRYIFLTPVLGAVGAAVIWGLGFISFVVTVAGMSPPAASLHTDGIVVLTGGAERVQTGLKLLKDDRANELLISGVHKAADLKDLLLLAHMPPDNFPCCITLGFEAMDTAGNARETATWAHDHHIKSLRLVTANYHMPRAYVELRGNLPGVRIIVHPVTPPSFSLATPLGWRLTITEYHKTILSAARLIRDRLTK